MRAAESLNEVKNEAGLDYPDRIFATNLRKHTATIAQVLIIIFNKFSFQVAVSAMSLFSKPKPKAHAIHCEPHGHICIPCDWTFHSIL